MSEWSCQPQARESAAASQETWWGGSKGAFRKERGLHKQWRLMGSNQQRRAWTFLPRRLEESLIPSEHMYLTCFCLTL